MTLTPAQLIALSVTPVTLVQAPGPGNIIVVVGCAFIFDGKTHAYFASGGDSLAVEYAGIFNTSVAASAAGLITGGSSGICYRGGLTSGQGAILPGDDNQGIQVVAASAYDVGSILTATLGAAGTGYALNDTGTITHGANDATYLITGVGALGAVTSFTITSGGTQYIIANNNATATGGAQPGVGVNFTINITALTLGNGILKVITYYQVVPIP